MTTPVKTFTAKFTDEFGGVSPQAIIAVHRWSATSQISGESEDCKKDYKVSTDNEAISYTGRFWYSAATLANGFRSRSVVIDKDGTFESLLDVDIEREEIRTVMSGDMDHKDKILLAIKLDFLHRFA
jgi:hypothetical protein